MLKRGNLADGCKQLQNCVSGVIVDDDVARRILNFNRDAEDKYIAFRNERYIDKKLSDTISKATMPDFAQTSKTASRASAESSSQVSIKEISYVQKIFEIEKSRGIPITEILEHDPLGKSPLFENQFTAKPDKHILIKELENAIVPNDYCFSKSSILPAALVIDFMSVVRKLSVSKYSTIKDVFESARMSITSVCSFEQLHLVYDSYLNHSLKECERLRRSSHETLDLFDLNECSKFSVQLERFWSSSVKKEGLQKLSRQYFSKVSVEEGARILLSGYVENQDDVIDCIESNGDSVENQRHLTSFIEEACSPHYSSCISRSDPRSENNSCCIH